MLGQADNDDDTAWPRSPWIDGWGLVEGRPARYITHTKTPRFTARVISDVWEDEPEADTLTGLTYRGAGVTLCEIVWTDTPPRTMAAQRALFEQATEAMAGIMAALDEADL